MKRALAWWSRLPPERQVDWCVLPFLLAGVGYLAGYLVYLWVS